MKGDDEGEWLPMTQERLFEISQQMVYVGIPTISRTIIIEDNRLPDGPKRIQPFKKIPRRRR